MSLPGFSSLIIKTLWIGSVIASLTSIALAQEAETAKVIGDGSRQPLKNGDEASIVPVKGWELITTSPTMTMIMQEPAAEKIEYNKPIYQRNITVAVMNTPAPIDEIRATELRQQLMDTFGKDASLKDFQIAEHKFFNYRGKNDGLLVFAQYTVGEFTMMQLHVLVSGEAQQFLMTYTDLASRFSDPVSYDLAWNAMQSIEVKGTAPVRYAELRQNAMFAGIGFLSLIVAFFFFKRRKRSYMAEADDVIYSDSHDSSAPITQSAVWNLKTGPMASHQAQPVSRAKGEGFSFVTGY